MKNDQITLGDVQNVYTRQIVHIPAGQIVQVDGVHSFFRIYSASGKIEVAAQNTGIFQTITAGTWVKNPIDEAGRLIQLPYIRFKNLEAFTVSVDLALSNGEVGDDAFLGTAQVSNYETNPLFVENTRPNDFKLTSLSVPANGSVTFTPDTNMSEFLIQNKSSGSVFLFSAAGLEMPTGSTFTGNLNKAFGVYNNTSAAAAVVITEFLR